MIGVENAYPIGLDTAYVKKFYDMGARYMSLAHNGHNQLSDSNTGEFDNTRQWFDFADIDKRPSLGTFWYSNDPTNRGLIDNTNLDGDGFFISHYKNNDFPADFFIKKCVHCGHYDHCEAVSGGNSYEFW